MAAVAANFKGAACRLGYRLGMGLGLIPMHSNETLPLDAAADARCAHSLRFHLLATKRAVRVIPFLPSEEMLCKSLNWKLRYFGTLVIFLMSW